MKRLIIICMLLSVLLLNFSGCYNITVKPSSNTSDTKQSADKLHRDMDKETGK
jgi:hypothetical protein